MFQKIDIYPNLIAFAVILGVLFIVSGIFGIISYVHKNWVLALLNALFMSVAYVFLIIMFIFLMVSIYYIIGDCPFILSENPVQLALYEKIF